MSTDTLERPTDQGHEQDGEITPAVDLTEADAGTAQPVEKPPLYGEQQKWAEAADTKVQAARESGDPAEVARVESGSIDSLRAASRETLAAAQRTKVEGLQRMQDAGEAVATPAAHDREAERQGVEPKQPVSLWKTLKSMFGGNETKS